MSPESETPHFHVHKSRHNPDIEGVSSMALYEGKRVKRDISYTVIRDRNTGAFHHDSVSLKTFRKRKDKPWKLDESSSITLSEDKDGELTKVIEFLQTCRGQDLEEGNYSLPDAHIHPLLKRYQKAHLVLRQLLQDPASESLDFTALLKYQPWIYGCEYSRLEEMSLDEQNNVFVYRSADSTLNVIKVLTPLDKEQRLFLCDEDLIAWYQGPELARALGQLQIAQDQVIKKLSVSGRDPGRVHCRLIMGHTHREKEQIKALRLLNHHLPEIDIITFDQLVYIGRQVISALEDACSIPV